MFRSVFAKTLRDLRAGVLGWGFGLGVLCAVTGAAWAKSYPDEASRLRLLQQIKGGLSASQVFYGEPHALDTLGGFIEWRVLGIGPVLLGLYAILAATGMARGAEEQRTIEVVACAVPGRLRMLGQQAAALLTGVIIATALVGVCVVVAGPASGEPAPAALRAAGEALNLAAAAALFGAVGLLTSQLFLRRRSAALAATGAMLVAHFLNTLPLVAPDMEPARYGSPLYLYSRSTPLSDGHVDVVAVAGLVALTAALFVGAMLLAARRDLFDVVRLPRLPLRRDVTQHPAGIASSSRFLQNAFTRGLDDSLGSVVAWSAALAALSALVTAITPNVRQAILDQLGGAIAKQLVQAGLTSEKAILSLLVFSLLLPLLAVFAVTAAASWASDETSLRLEIELSTPAPRWRTFVQRWLASVVALSVTVLVVALAVAVTIEVGGLNVPLTGLANATWTLAVLAACVAAVGFAVASWRPGMTATLAGVFVALSYFVNLLVPLFGLPHWTSYASVFGLYGSPLVDGVGFIRTGAMAALTVVLVTAGALEFQRRDIVK
jgi:ABC-2 type transport system permease protein